MPPGTPPSFDSVCAVVGRLYLELEQTNRQLRERIQQLEHERDEALRVVAAAAGRQE